MTDPLEHIISQAEKIIKENNKVYQQLRTSAGPSQTAFAVRARNTAGDMASFITVRGTYDEASWMRAFYAQGWVDVNVYPTVLEGPVTYATVPSAATTPGDVDLSRRQRGSVGTATSIVLQPLRNFNSFSIPVLGVTSYAPTPHTPTAPYGVSSSDNDIQLYFMGLSNDQKYEMRWEGGNFLDWWEMRAAIAAAPSGTATHPHANPTSPEVVAAFAQKIPYKREAGYDEFLKLMRKVKSTMGDTDSELLPDDVLIDEYESRTGNVVRTIYYLGKQRVMKFRDYDRDLILTSLENLRRALKVTEQYEIDQRAADQVDIDARDRANRFRNQTNEIADYLSGLLGSGKKSKTDNSIGEKYKL